LDLWFKSYEVFKILAQVWAYCQPLSMEQNLPKTAKICPSMPKDKILKYHQKSRFLCFSKIKISMYRSGTGSCFYHLVFQSKNFSYAIFIVKKRPLYVNFSISPCGNWWFLQGSTPCVGMRFCGHVSNSPRNNNLKFLNPYLF
jgi:hypothetical protein